MAKVKFRKRRKGTPRSQLRRGSSFKSKQRETSPSKASRRKSPKGNHNGHPAAPTKPEFSGRPLGRPVSDASNAPHGLGPGSPSQGGGGQHSGNKGGTSPAPTAPLPSSGSSNAPPTYSAPSSSSTSSSSRYTKKEKAYFRARRQARETKKAISAIQKDLEQASNQREKEALREERQQEQERYKKPEKPESLVRKQERQDAREFADKVVGKVPHQAKEGAKKIARVQEKRKLIREVKVAAKMGELTAKSVGQKQGKVPRLESTARGEIQREGAAAKEQRRHDRERAEQKVLTKSLRQGIKGKAKASRRAAKSEYATTVYKMDVDAFKAKYNRKPMKNERKSMARHAVKAAKRAANDPENPLGHDIRRQRRQLKVLGAVQEEGKKKFGERLEQLLEEDSGASSRQQRLAERLMYGPRKTKMVKRGKTKVYTENAKGESVVKKEPRFVEVPTRAQRRIRKGKGREPDWRTEDAFGAELGAIRRTGRQDEPRLITKAELGARKQARWIAKREEAERLANQGALANALDMGETFLREVGDIPQGLLVQAGTVALLAKDAAGGIGGVRSDGEAAEQVRAMAKGFQKTDPAYGAIEMLLQGYSLGEVATEFKDRGRASPISLLSDLAMAGGAGLKVASLGKVSATTRIPYKVAATADAEGLGTSGIKGILEVGRRRKAFVRAQQAQRNVLKAAKKDAKAEAKAKAGPNESKASIKDRERRIYEQRASDLQEAHNEIMFERYGGGETQAYTRFRGGRVSQKARESWQGFRGRDPFVKTGESGARRLAKRLGFRFKAERTGEMRGAAVQQQFREYAEAGALSHQMLSADARAIMDDPNAGWGVVYDAYFARVGAAASGYLKRGVNEIRRNQLTPSQRGDISVAIGSRMGGLVKDGIEASDLDALIKGAKANGNDAMAASYQRLYDDLMQNGDHALINSKGVKDAAEVERKFNLETEPEGLTREQRHYHTTVQRYAARNEIADIGKGERAIYDPETRNLIGIERADGSIRAAYGKEHPDDMVRGKPIERRHMQRELEPGPQKAPDVFEAAPGATIIPAGEAAGLSYEEIVATLRMAQKVRRTPDSPLIENETALPDEFGQASLARSKPGTAEIKEGPQPGAARSFYEADPPVIKPSESELEDAFRASETKPSTEDLLQEAMGWVSERKITTSRGKRGEKITVTWGRGEKAIHRPSPELVDELKFYGDMFDRAGAATAGVAQIWDKINWYEKHRDRIAASMAAALYDHLAKSMSRNASAIGPYGIDVERLMPADVPPSAAPPLPKVLEVADQWIEKRQMELLQSIVNSPDPMTLANRARHEALRGMHDAWMRELVRSNDNRPLPLQAWQPGAPAWRATVRYELARLKADARYGDEGAKVAAAKLERELDLVENWPKHWKSLRQIAIDRGIEIDKQAAKAGEQLANLMRSNPDSRAMDYMIQTAEDYGIALDRLRQEIMASDSGKVPPALAVKLPLATKLIEKHRPKPEERVVRQADGVEPEMARLEREAKLEKELRDKAYFALSKRERKAYRKRERIRAEVKAFEGRPKPDRGGSGFARLADAERKAKIAKMKATRDPAGPDQRWPTIPTKRAWEPKSKGGGAEPVYKKAPEPSQPPKRSEAAAGTDRGVEAMPGEGLPGVSATLPDGDLSGLTPYQIEAGRGMMRSQRMQELQAAMRDESLSPSDRRAAKNAHDEMVRQNGERVRRRRSGGERPESVWGTGDQGPVRPGSELGHKPRRIYGPRMSEPGAVFRTLRTDEKGRLRIIVTGEPNRYGAIMDPLEGLGDEMGLRDQKVSAMTGTTRVRELDLTDPENDVGAVNRRRHLFNSWQELVDIIKQSSYKGGTPFDDWEAELARLHAPGKERYVAIAADQRSLPKIDGKVDSARVFKGTNIVKAKPGEPAFLMPERMMKVAQAHMRKQGSLEAALHVPARLFVAAVLPFSIGWHVGNMMDLLTRVGVAGAWVDDAKLARQFYDEYSKLVGKDRADAFFVNIAGHYGSQKSVLEAERAALSKSPAGQKVTQGANQLLDKMDEAYPGWGASVRDIGSAATAPARGLRWASQKGFNMASKFEEPYVNMAGGHALRLLARELGLDIGDHVAMAKALARQAEWDKTLMDEFARKAVEIVGDYSMSPWARRWIAPIDPFFRWVVEANKFIFYHFPAKHPVKFLLSAYAAQMGNEMAEKLGIDDYLEGNGLFDVALGGTGYLAGAIPIGEGWFRPTSALTSWGETSKMLEDPLDYIGGKVFPYFQGIATAAAGYDPTQKAGILAVRAMEGKLAEWFPNDTQKLKDTIYPNFHMKGNEWAMENARAEGSGLLNAIDAGAGSFVPGYSQLASLGREGGVPDNNSWQSVPGTQVPLQENKVFNPMGKARPMFGDHEDGERDYYPDKDIASLAARMKDHLPPTNVNMVLYTPSGKIIQNQGDRFHNEWVEITPEEAKAWEKEHRSSKGSIPLSQRQGGTKTPGGVPVESRPGGANGPGGVPLVMQRGGRETLGKIPLDQMSSKGAAARGLSIVEGIIDTVNDPSTKQAIDVGRRYAQAFEKQQSSGGFKVDGDFSDNQKRYIETLAKETDLDPQAVGAWVIAESGGASTGLPDWDGGEHFGREYFNYLNIGPWMEDEQLFESPEAAAHGTAEFLKGKQWGPGANIPDILPLAAGKGPEAAIAAIERAGWDVANYSGQSGISDLLSQVKVTRTPESKGYKVPRQLRMEAAAIYGQKGLRLLEQGGKIIRAPKKGESMRLPEGFDPEGAKKAALADLTMIPKEYWADASGDKRTPEENASVGGSATSDHLTTSTNTFAADLPPSEELANKIAANLGLEQSHGLQEADINGVHYQLIWQYEGHYDHIHLGAEVTDESKIKGVAPQGVKIKGTNLMITEPAPAAAAAVTPSGAPAAAISTGGSAPPTSGGVGSVSRETQGRKAMNPFKGMKDRGDALQLALQLLRGEISVLEYVQARNGL